MNTTTENIRFHVDKIRNAWAKSLPITIDNTSFRVGKMSYGDYFLEPGTDRGEKTPFNNGTIWLKRDKNDRNMLIPE